ncbi:MAG: hypothetical protein ACE5EM_12675 [Sphingomonadales bacterium]
MTDRNLDPAVKTETEAPEVTSVVFVELDFDSGPVRVWSGMGPIMAAMPDRAAATWDGVGDLGSIDAISESADRTQHGVQLTLSGIDPDLLTTALEENYQGRAADIWIAFLDASHQVIGEPVSVFGGIMDVMSTIDGDETGLLSLTCESREALLGRSSESLLTDQEQQRLHPGDNGLNFVMELQNKEILWGMPSPTPAGGGANHFREFAR